MFWRAVLPPYTIPFIVSIEAVHAIAVVAAVVAAERTHEGLVARSLSAGSAYALFPHFVVLTTVLV